MKFGKDILIIATLTLITILVWIGVEVHQTLSKEAVPKVLKEQISPLDDQLSGEVFEKLRTRGSFTEEELSVRTAPEEVPPEEEAVPEENPEDSQESSESADLSN